MEGGQQIGNGLSFLDSAAIEDEKEEED